MTPLPTDTRRLFLVGMLVFALSGLIPAGFGLAVPLFAKSYGLPEVEVGRLLSFGGLGAILSIGATVLGVRGLSSRVGLALMSAGFLGFWLIGPFSGKLASALVIGMGQGITGVVFNRRFLQEFGDRGPGMLGLINAAFGAGAIIAPMVIVALGNDVPLAFGLGGMALFVLLFVVRPGAPAPAPLPLLALVNRRWWILLLALGAASIEIGATGFGPAALIAHGHTPEGAASLLSGFFLAYLVSRLMIFLLFKVLSPPAIFLISTVLSAASLGLAALGFPAVGFVFAGAAIGIAFPALFVWVTRLLGDDNRVSAAILGASLGGIAVAPALYGPVIGALGVDATFGVIAVLAAGVALAGALSGFRR